MGEIKKQSIIGTIYTSLGVLLGFLISAVILPRVLSTDQIGLISILLAYSAIFAQFGSLGFNHITTRLFPYFRDKENNHNGFFLIAILVSIVGFLIIIGVFFIIKPFILSGSIDKSPLLHDYIIYIIPLTFFTLFFNLFDHYNKVLFNATRGTLFKEVYKRLFILVSVAFYYFNLVSFSNFILIYVFANALPAMIMYYLLANSGEVSLHYSNDFIKKDFRREMVSVAFFGILSSTTASFTLQIDRIMVERFLGLSDTGIYATAFYFGTLVMLPSHVMLKISSAYIAEAWKKNDIAKVADIYKKSCNVLYIGGLFVFLGLWINIDNIFQILPDKFEAGSLALLLIAGSFLVDALTGASHVIMVTSKHFKYFTYIKLLLIALLIITNLIFIPIWGITGAAFASLLSKFIQHLVKYVVLYRFYKFQPYGFNFILATILAIAVYLGSYYLIPQFDNYIWDIIIRSGIVSILFWALIYVFKVSQDVNEQIDSWLKKYLGINVH